MKVKYKNQRQYSLKRTKKGLFYYQKKSNNKIVFILLFNTRLFETCQLS